MMLGVVKLALVNWRSRFGGCLYAIMVEHPSNVLLMRSDLVFFKASSMNLTVLSCVKLLANVDTKINLFSVLLVGAGAGPWSFASWNFLLISFVG